MKKKKDTRDDIEKIADRMDNSILIFKTRNPGIEITRRDLILEALKDVSINRGVFFGIKNTDKREGEICGECGQKVKPEWREITLYKGMVVELDKIYRWCKQRNNHEFVMGDVKHLIDQVDYARLNDLVRVGGLLYRPDGAKRGVYGINMDRVYDFLSGKTTVPERVWKSSKGNGIKKEGEIYVHQIKGAKEYLDEDGVYQVEYRHNVQEPAVEKHTNAWYSNM